VYFFGVGGVCVVGGVGGGGRWGGGEVKETVAEAICREAYC